MIWGGISARFPCFRTELIVVPGNVVLTEIRQGDKILDPVVVPFVCHLNLVF